MTNVVKRLLYDQQKDWFNKNNWSIFQSALVSKGATTYRYPTTTTAALDDKVVFLGDENQINHFNANPADIAKNIMVSRYGPQWEPVGDVISGSVAPSSRRNVASSADGSVIAIKIGDYDMFHSGPVRIYKFTNGLWKQKGGDITPQNDGLVVSPLLQFMSTSLSYDGSVVAIGAVRQSDNSDTSYRGTVNVYKFDDNSGSWLDRGAVINGERKQDYSGWSTSLSADGSRLAIGAYKNDDNGNESGHVRVYKYSNNQWVQLGSDIVGEIAGAQSGYSVSLSADGSVVAIGAIYNTNNQGDVIGHVRVYEYDGAFGSGWRQRGGNIDGEGPWDGSGNSVSLSADGSVVAIGASMIFNLSDRNLDTGHVRVYRYKPNKTTAVTDQSATNYGPIGWDRIGKDIDGEGEDDFSGYSVSLSHDGSVVAIGSLNNNVRVFHYRKYTEDDDKNGVSKFNYVSRTVDTSQTKPVIITSEFETITKPLAGNSYWTQVGLDINQSGKQVSLSDDGTIVAIGPRVYQIAKRSLWVQQGLDIDGESSFNQSGFSISLSADGSIVAIGAYGNNNGAGHVRVYQFREGLWQQLGGDIDAEDAGDASGFSISLSTDGSIVAIGAPGNNNSAGHVRVYEYNTGNWSKVGGDIDGEAADDESGFSVSLSSDGNVVAIGSFLNTDGRGYVRVYEYREYRNDDDIIDVETDIRNSKFNYTSTVVNDEQTKPILILESSDETSPLVGNSYWMQLGSDIDGETATSGHSSVSLSADGLIVAIGAPHVVNNNDSGHVRVYEFKDGSWRKIGEDIDGEAGGDESGISVSLSEDGSVVAIGAIGHVRVFEYRKYTDDDDDGNGDSKFHYSSREVNGEQTKPLIITKDFQTPPNVGQSYWIQQGLDIDGEAGGDESGWSVSLSADGSIVAIGAPYNDSVHGEDSGHVRVYKYDGSSWRQLELDIDGEAAFDESGYSVSLSHDGSVVAIGARKNDGVNGNDSGHVRVYKSAGWGLGAE